MDVRLTIQNGPQAGRHFLIRSGQSVRFGRTAWSDHALPYDEALADVHFAIESNTRGVVLIDQSRGRGTLVSGAPISRSTLQPGQTFQAGTLEFLVEFQTVASPSRAVGGEPLVSEPPPVPPCQSLIEQAGLTRPALRLLNRESPVDQGIRTLAEAQLWADAWGLVAAWVGKPVLVEWTARQIEAARGPDLSPSEREHLLAAQNWVASPGMETEQLVRRSLQDDDLATAAAWVAQAAAWSGTSLADPEGPVIPPPPGLAARALNAAWNLVAAKSGPPAPVLRSAIDRAIEFAKQCPPG